MKLSEEFESVKKSKLNLNKACNTLNNENVALRAQVEELETANDIVMESGKELSAGDTGADTSDSSDVTSKKKKTEPGGRAVRSPIWEAPPRPLT